MNLCDFALQREPETWQSCVCMPSEPDFILLTVNGERTPAPFGTTVYALLAQLALTGPVAAEVNGTIVVRAKHAECVLKDGDVLELVHFVGGG